MKYEEVESEMLKSLDRKKLQKLYDVFNVAITVFSEGKIALMIPDKIEFGEMFERNDDIFRSVESTLKNEKCSVFFEDQNIYYGVIKLDDDDSMLLSPLCRKNVSREIRIAFQHRHTFSGQIHIHSLAVEKFLDILSLFVYEFINVEISPARIKLANKVESVYNWNLSASKEKYEIEKSEDVSEKKIPSGDAALEKKILSIVESGDVKAMEKMVKNPHTIVSDYQETKFLNEFKKAEYSAVSMVVLLTRVAIGAGVVDEEARGLGDVFLERISNCKTEIEIYSLILRAQYEFTQKVNEAKSEKFSDYHVRRSKDFIYKNLRKPFKVSDVADALGINRTYLSKKFSENTGMTLQEFIMKERCAHAAVLLRTSKYPISIIAEYFCFSSQSHFGNQFKKFYGMTPLEYRRNEESLK